jgi:hypothetical protein
MRTLWSLLFRLIRASREPPLLAGTRRRPGTRGGRGGLTRPALDTVPETVWKTMEYESYRKLALRKTFTNS